MYLLKKNLKSYKLIIVEINKVNKEPITFKDYYSKASIKIYHCLNNKFVELMIQQKSQEEIIQSGNYPKTHRGLSILYRLNLPLYLFPKKLR
jgi:hypothetical protein